MTGNQDIVLAPRVGEDDSPLIHGPALSSSRSLPLSNQAITVSESMSSLLIITRVSCGLSCPVVVGFGAANGDVLLHSTKFVVMDREASYVGRANIVTEAL